MSNNTVQTFKMGAFNILQADVQCSYCKKEYETAIQFKFGDTWQLKYKIYDMIQWGGNDIGERNLQKVKVYGISEKSNCSVCGNINLNIEFDIYIENDSIKEIKLMSNPEEYFEEEGCYKVIAK